MSKKLTILVDLDSITADLQEKWYEAYNAEYDDNITNDDILTWDTHKYVKPECGKRIYKYFTPSLFKSLNPIKGAIKGLKALVDAGHEVVFVTASPKGCSEAKFSWVKEHCPFIKEVIMAHKKYLILGDVLIDDSPSNIISYREHHPHANIFTIAYPYNESVEGLTDLRLGSWRDTEAAWEGFVKAIEELAFNSETGDSKPSHVTE